MYRRFEVRNFRGISHLVLDKLARVNILTGLNNSGKTTALEAFFLHASGPLAGTTSLTVLSRRRPSGGSASSILDTTKVNPWRSLFRNLESGTPIHLGGEVSETLYELEIAADSGRLTTLPPSTSGSNDPADFPLASLRLTTKRDRIESRYTLSAMPRVDRRTPHPESAGAPLEFRLEPAAVNPFTLATLLQGDGRIDLASGYSDLRRQGGIENDLLDALRIVDHRIAGVEVLITDGSPELHAVTAAGQSLPFHLMGDGAIAVANYIVLLARSRNGLLLIDEIGRDLHYSTLVDLWRVLHQTAERFDVQLVATTHSAECIRAAQEALLPQPGTLQVSRLSRSRTDEPTVAFQYSDDKLLAAQEMNAELR